MKKIAWLPLLIFIIISCATDSFEKKFPISDTFMPSYQIASFEDLSLNNGSNKILRHQYRVVLPKGLSEADIKSNMRHLAMHKYKQHGVKNLSILAYKDKNDINGPFTASLYELCPHGEWGQTNRECSDDSYEEHLIVSPSYYIETVEKFTVGRKVVLSAKTEYDRNKKDFVPASKTTVSSCPTDFSDDKIRKIKNGIKGSVIEICTKKLTGGSCWVAYKVRFNDSSLQDGWVLEEDLSENE